MNSDLEDGIGPMDGSGHYQFAPSFDQTKIDGTVTTDANGFSYALLVDDSDESGELEVTIGWPAGISQAGIDKIKVYPNPALNELNIVLERENSTFSIYNSVGVKLEEAEVRGTEHRLDISTYTPGIYYIRSGNTVIKFVK